jgi:isoprenylcysteine carboxyl methyltransferase (ICMT) family protein YpbQ
MGYTPSRRVCVDRIAMRRGFPHLVVLVRIENPSKKVIRNNLNLKKNNAAHLWRPHSPLIALIAPLYLLSCNMSSRVVSACVEWLATVMMEVALMEVTVARHVTRVQSWNSDYIAVDVENQLDIPAIFF